MEQLDNLYDFIKGINFVEVIKAVYINIIAFFEQIDFNSIWNGIKKGVSKLFPKDVTLYEIAYFVGYVATFFIPFGWVANLVGRAGKAGRVILKAYALIDDLMAKVFGFVLNKGKSVFNVIIQFFRGLFRKFNSGKNAIIETIKELFDNFTKWLDDVFPKWRKVLSFDERYKLVYKRPKSLFRKLSRKEIIVKYGKIAGKLFDEVEIEWKKARTGLSGNKRGELGLVSGMTDIKTGRISKLFKNFTSSEIKRKEHLKFLEKLHPTLKKRLNEHLKRRGENGEGLNLEDPDVIVFAWEQIDKSHAEFRALDDLLKKIDKNGELGEKVFERIIGYNSFLRKEGIQHTCADCFYLTHGVTYIK